MPGAVRGILLDAMERLDGPATGEEALEAFLAAVATAPGRRGRSVGMGEDLRLEGAGVIGSGLVLGKELIQLSAYARDGHDARVAQSRRLGGARGVGSDGDGCPAAAAPHAGRAHAHPTWLPTNRRLTTLDQLVHAAIVR
jgi:ARG/rhodanese/phosphatase superfamily protein